MFDIITDNFELVTNEQVIAGTAAAAGIIFVKAAETINKLWVAPRKDKNKFYAALNYLLNGLGVWIRIKKKS